MGEREDDPSEVHSERASPHFFSLELECRCHLPHSLFLLISPPFLFRSPRLISLLSTLLHEKQWDERKFSGGRKNEFTNAARLVGKLL